MKFWYTVDIPRNQPCWEVNPNLWESFCTAMMATWGIAPRRDRLYTEQYVVQRMDSESNGEWA